MKPIGTIVKAEPIVVSKTERFSCCSLLLLFVVGLAVGVMII